MCNRWDFANRADRYLDFLKAIGQHIREGALEAQRRAFSRYGSPNEEFERGRLDAFRQIVTNIADQGEVLAVTNEEIGFNDLDPEIDLTIKDPPAAAGGPK